MLKDRCLQYARQWRDNRRLIEVFSLFLIFYSLLRAIRAPNLWSASQIYWNYGFGFIRRGFLGEVFRQLDIHALYSYSFFYWLSFFIFAVEMLLLCRLFRHVQALVKQGGIFLSLWFISLSFAFLIHTIGYADQIHIILLVCLILLPFDHRFAGPVMLACCIAGMLTHELFLAFAGPVIFFKTTILWSRKSYSLEKAILHYRWVWFSLTICVLMGMALLFGPGATLPQPGLENLVKWLQQHVDFPLRHDLFTVLETDGGTTMDRMSESLSLATSKDIIARALKSALPTTAFYIYLAFLIIQQTYKGNKAVFLWLLFLVLSLSPLTVMRFAWDYARLASLTGTMSFLLTLTLIHTTQKKISLTAWHTTLLWAGVLIYNLTADIELMDGYTLVQPPFNAQWDYLRAVMEHQAPFPRIPGM
jgi:hypothetical protein